MIDPMEELRTHRWQYSLLIALCAMGLYGGGDRMIYI